MRRRRVYSIERELVTKAQEAALSAVQIFNNPLIKFKSELFIVGMNIAWTYMMHAYYRKTRIDYHYFVKVGGRKRFDKTKYGAKKAWVLETCLYSSDCPLDKNTCNNLRFLIGIRHEIEHQMTTRIDNTLSAKFQACCINFNRYIKQLFGESFGIDEYLPVSLQFSSISREQNEGLNSATDLPGHIRSYIAGFEGNLSQEEFDSPGFAYRVLLVPKSANRKGQADEVIEFIKSDSPLADEVNKRYIVIKDTERPKFLPAQVVNQMKDEGYNWFNMQHHTELWKSVDAKAPGKGYGILVANKQWLWYESWIDFVRADCSKRGQK